MKNEFYCVEWQLLLHGACVFPSFILFYFLTSTEEVSRFPDARMTGQRWDNLCVVCRRNLTAGSVFFLTKPNIVMLNCFSCFRLAPMGLADMMTPGESKLPLPLKADGKEEGPPQPESKSKVFTTSARGVGSARRSLLCCPPSPGFGLPTSVLSCMPFHSRAISLFLFFFSFFFFPSLCGSESYQFLRHFNLRWQSNPSQKLRGDSAVPGGWGRRVLPGFSTCSHFSLPSVIASCFGRLSSSNIL